MCDGTGHIKQSLVVVDEMESNLTYISTSQNGHRYTIVTHPYIHAYLTRGGLRSIRAKWMLRHRTWLTIKSTEKMGLLEYKFLDANGTEIEI